MSCHNASFISRDNPKYKTNVNRLADLFAASRHHPLDEAAWLMEFVASTKGADHLKIASRHLSIIQLYCLDVILFMITIPILVFKLVIGIIVVFRQRMPKIKQKTVGKVKKSQ